MKSTPITFLITAASSALLAQPTFIGAQLAATPNRLRSGPKKDAKLKGQRRLRKLKKRREPHSKNSNDNGQFLVIPEEEIEEVVIDTPKGKGKHAGTESKAGVELTPEDGSTQEEEIEEEVLDTPKGEGEAVDVVADLGIGLGLSSNDGSMPMEETTFTKKRFGMKASIEASADELEDMSMPTGDSEADIMPVMSMGISEPVLSMEIDELIEITTTSGTTVAATATVSSSETFTTTASSKAGKRPPTVTSDDSSASASDSAEGKSSGEMATIVGQHLPESSSSMKSPIMIVSVAVGALVITL